MESRLDLDTEFGNLAISEGFITPAQASSCQRIADTFGGEYSRNSLDAVMVERGYITPEQRDSLLKILGITFVFCPYCKKGFKEADTDIQEIMYCKHCEKSFEYQHADQMDMHQASITSGKTLASFHQQTCDFYIGKLLGDKYEIVEKIAVGGWSTIYKAKRKMLDIDDVVAMKILHVNLRENPQDIKRFYNEAATICELRHPNAIYLYDFDRDAQGTIYMAMEFVHGKNLKEIIRDNGPITVARMLHIIFQVCDVISAAHKHPKKIIHRDITPQNIMLSRVGEADDFVKVLDFGIAKLWLHDHVSLTGSIVGTPLYMAPEQWEGGCDERTDIYSLGIIMYEMLTGETPFQGDQVVLMNKHLHAKPLPFRRLNKKLAVPPYIERIILKCLEKNKDKRPQSVDELKSLLQNEQSSTTSIFSTYPSRTVLVMILILLLIPLTLYPFFWPGRDKKDIPSLTESVSTHKESSQKILAFQKNDSGNRYKVPDNAGELFFSEEFNRAYEFYKTCFSQKPVLTPPDNNNNGSKHIVATKLLNKDSPDKGIDLVQEYDPGADYKKPVPDTNEPIKNEIQEWLQNYKKAWEMADIEALKELGEISSKKEEKKLRKHYSYVNYVTVSIQNVVIDVQEDGCQAVISFDQEDEWTDEKSNRHRKVPPRITKILRKEDGAWKIEKITDQTSRQAMLYKKYKHLWDGIALRYDNFKKRVKLSLLQPERTNRSN
ncbi:MAG: hypothetical protein DCC43_07885 [Candidatus Brocadia sp.]|jgi:Serine/threonine protein kinase|uniref:Protein kinase domain-containing protein n=1 Tax=Candidatus Brocadia fulgida TaxID=380242 RepID=A0A0M2UTA3_9BACT|nr:MAG: hypothetical protein BROFUL_02438 [Candidatus Brocadia fulgida]MCC6324137.1 serine/threonine protein kinase [Candidatus Brocadia sp.]MCE7912058.1 serine/threonine protein kinase [Candidatus Brocadia sp. AMX3]MBV6518219.1 Serine/threonine-protein kinase PknD [Candidatus Brocadia fulgida]MDG5997467.1 serine/threonine protein kinase [Candidatus Brocadia sp.]